MSVAVALVRDRVTASGLLPPRGRGRLLVLCSGGRDSRCLLHVSAALLGGESITVLHINHGLRAEASDDAELVREAAAQAGVQDLRVLPAGPAPSAGGGNLHAWARERRRALAAGVVAELEAAAGGPVVVASAHTRTDLVETVLGRLATQPGRRALLGPAARSTLPRTQPAASDAPAGAAPPIALVRPLLGTTREETTAYCVAAGLRWAEDPSNANARFARARLRHEVLPVLRTLNPQAEAAIARTVGELCEEREALEAIVAAELGSAGGVARARLAELPAPIGRLVLRELCERATGRPVPQATARLAEVLALAPGGELDVGAGARVRVASGVVRCVASQGPAAPQA